MRRTFAALVVLAAIAFTVPAAASTPESELFAKINQERQSAGIASLAQNSTDLLEVARRHSARMAKQNRLHHNDNLPGEVSGWRALGENVGTGPDTASIHQAFMDSPSHRAQILDGTYTEAAVGVVVVDGTLWVTEILALRDASNAAFEARSMQTSRVLASEEAVSIPLAMALPLLPTPAAPNYLAAVAALLLLVLVATSNAIVWVRR